MQPSPSYRQVLYISQLAATQGYEVFTSICRIARPRNAQLSSTGVLLFDGQRFCQLLQGPPAAIDALMARIEKDARHEGLVMLADMPIDAADADIGWQAGFCEADDLDVFERPRALAGDAAVEAFRAIVSRADLAP